MIFDTNKEFFRIIRFFIITIVIGVIIMTLLIPSVFAYTGPLDPDDFYINSQSDTPFHITINGNSNTITNFHLYWLTSGDNQDIPGSYLFFSVVSDKKIDIQRNNSFGSSCSSSCFSNDKYLQLTSSSNGVYNYVFYFNIVKWQIVMGTQIVEWKVDDTFKFINKESGTANVYIYGTYSSVNNEMAGLINDVNTTNNIIDNQNNNTTDIINNDDNNTQTIIDNDNANTDKIIESNQVCSFIDKSNIKKNGYYLDSNGVLQESANLGVTDFININNGILKVVNASTSGSYLCFYDVNQTKISCSALNTFNNGQTISIPQNSVYFRSTIVISQNKPTYNVCINGQQANNNAINGLNDTINNSGIDTPNSDFSEMEDMIAENGVITNLLSLPITLYSKILNSVNGTCSNYNLGSLYGTNITFSCISLQNILGSTIWGVIDILFSGFTIYAIAKKMIKVFNSMSSLKEGDVIDD